MSALVLKQDSYVPPVADDPNTPQDESQPGHWEYKQDEDTGAMIRVWVSVPDDVIEPPSAVNTPGGMMEGTRFKCIARGFTDGGIRVAGTTERFSSRGTIDTVDFVTIKFPPFVVLTRRDRVTDIRNNKNILLWKEEEFDDRPTVFEVNGVTPIIDPFGNHIENSALLQRAEIQSLVES
jgi:hypothetical protein